MHAKSWTLVDVGRDVFVDSLCVGPTDVGGTATRYQVKKSTLRGGLRDGVDAVEIDNGRLRFVVLPTRGMGIWKAWCGDLEIGWRSPVQGPVHPKFVPLAEPTGLGWLAGFDELLCRCGLESNGGPVYDEQGRLQYALHGRIANTTAHRVELSIDGDSGEIALKGVIDEARLYHQKLQLASTVRTRVGESVLRISDEVVNLSAEEAQLELLYHINFGQPLLDAGSKVVLPAARVIPQTPRAADGISAWDTYEREQRGFAEQVYLFELLADAAGETQTLLRNAHGNYGVSLHFTTKTLPCFTIWKSTQAASDGYVTGLEPGINYPNLRPFESEQGRVARLAPGEKRVFELRLEVHVDAEAVAVAETKINQILQGREPKVHDLPTLPWAPA